jgi:hypothetical protein
VTTPDGVARSYRAAFLRYLARPEEAARHAGYEIGRAALAADVSLLQLVRVHHDVLAGVLRETPAEEVPDVAGAASDMLLELLSSYDMVQRGFRQDG